jgi:hypothetical protein
MVFNVLFNCMTLDISGDDLDCFTHVTVYFFIISKLCFYTHIMAVWVEVLCSLVSLNQHFG